MRLLRLIRALPLWMALTAWVAFVAATLVLPGCSFTGGGVQGRRFVRRDISNAAYQLGILVPLLLAVALPWFAAVSLVIALVEPRRT